MEAKEAVRIGAYEGLIDVLICLKKQGDAVSIPSIKGLKPSNGFTTVSFQRICMPISNISFPIPLSLVTARISLTSSCDLSRRLSTFPKSFSHHRFCLLSLLLSFSFFSVPLLFTPSFSRFGFLAISLESSISNPRSSVSSSLYFPLDELSIIPLSTLSLILSFTSPLLVHLSLFSISKSSHLVYLSILYLPWSIVNLCFYLSLPLFTLFSHTLSHLCPFLFLYFLTLSLYLFSLKKSPSNSLFPPFLSLTSLRLSPDFPTSQLILSLFFSLLLLFFLPGLDFFNSSFHYFL